MRYTDPDGRYAYSVEIRKGEFVLETSTMKGKLVEDACGFAPFGGTLLTLMNKVVNRKDLNSSEFDSLKNESQTYILDILGTSLGIFEKFKSLSDCASQISNVLGIFSVLSDLCGSYGKNSDTDIDILVSDVFNKLCNYSIKGKSHEAVAKKYFMAKGVIKGLLLTGDLKYSKDWKNDNTSINLSGKDAYKILKELKSYMQKMEE